MPAFCSMVLKEARVDGIKGMPADLAGQHGGRGGVRARRQGDAHGRVDMMAPTVTMGAPWPTLISVSGA